MYVTITSIRLKTLWHFFALSTQAMFILKQLNTSKGHIKVKKTGLGLTHYTLSVWETEADLKKFMQSGAHLKSMQGASKIAKAIGAYIYETATIPDWKVAKKLLKEKGRFTNY